MSLKKQDESKTSTPTGLISLHANEWFGQFIKHLELNFVEMSERQPIEVDVSFYQLSTVRAVLQTLLDSGLSTEAVLEMFAQSAIDPDLNTVEWTSDMNKRRFDLIDKEIQGRLSPAEQIELAGLTKIMRRHVESEMNLPLEGAKSLHEKLMKVKVDERL